MTNKTKNIIVDHLFTYFGLSTKRRTLLKRGGDILITGIVLLTVSDASRRNKEDENMVEAFHICQEPHNVAQTTQA
ncbi:MAG: hypothetical protein K2Y18_00975 [Alphaproteobacteria bacterium]|jgi:hypothetical protein|nr:hypothetical protein [Alphaproteobacteria bacterium]